MIKKPRVLLKLSFIVVATAAAIPLMDLGYCYYVLAGAVDSDKALIYRDGIAFAKGEETPFTGAAYQSVCGGDCGFSGCSSIHWYSEFDNGKRSMSFLPESGETNGFFSISLFGGFQRVHYDNDARDT